MHLWLNKNCNEIYSLKSIWFWNDIIRKICINCAELYSWLKIYQLDCYLNFVAKTKFYDSFKCRFPYFTATVWNCSISGRFNRSFYWISIVESGMRKCCQRAAIKVDQYASRSILLAVILHWHMSMWVPITLPSEFHICSWRSTHALHKLFSPKW